MFPPASSTASSPAQPSAARVQPATRPSSPLSAAHREHAARLAREQQQMIEELMSTGLVQAADLMALGFTEAEIAAAGFHVPLPPHKLEEEQKVTRAAAAVTGAVSNNLCVEDDSSEARRGKARKRGWHEEQDDGLSPTTRDTQEPKTAVKMVSGAATTTAVLSEQRRSTALQSAHTVDQQRDQRRAAAGATAERDDCARALDYDEEDESALESHGGLTAVTAFKPHSKRCVNTALNFSGADVAVVKEMASLLRAPVDEEARLERLRAQEYLDSREEGNTPYM